MTNPNDRVFPCEWSEESDDETGFQSGWVKRKSLGLTKRELAAFFAMNGILQNSVNHDKEVRFSEQSVAKGAVEYADALLAELAKGAL